MDNIATKTIQLNNGKTIVMEMEVEDDGEGEIGDVEIRFWENGEELDQHGFDFKCDEFNKNRFLLTWMDSPYPRMGLGEAALRFFKAVMGDVSIWTRERDGIPREDQSHLTDKAFSFVPKMQSLGLIEDWADTRWSEDDY